MQPSSNARLFFRRTLTRIYSINSLGIVCIPYWNTNYTNANLLHIDVETGNKDITSSAKLEIRPNRSVQIASVLAEDNGDVTCGARNSTGTIRKTFNFALTGL